MAMSFAHTANERTVTEMSKWVDADWIKDRNSFVPKRELHTVEEFMQILDEAPTIDAVPVVRCRDCRYHEDEQPGMVYCPATVGGWVEDDWFCKGGERKDGDGDATN
jgi:hypothetical protein